MTKILTYGPMTARLVAARGAPEGLGMQHLDLAAAAHIDELYAVRHASFIRHEEESAAAGCVEGCGKPGLRR